MINGYKNKYDINKEEQKETNNSLNDEKDELGIKNTINNSHRNNEINFENPSKFINIKNGDIQLFKKFKNKQIPIKNTNSNIKRKLNSKNNKTNINNKFNSTNPLAYLINLNNSKSDLNMNSYLNKNKPIILNHNKKQRNDEMLQQIMNKNNKDMKDENENYLYLNNNIEQIQEKINNLKYHFCFNGNNEEFIKYLKVIKIKADLTHLVEILFNNGENLNEGNAEECFCKLGNLLDYKFNEEKNLLNGYQYLFENLLKINNLDKNDINIEI